MSDPKKLKYIYDGTTLYEIDAAYADRATTAYSLYSNVTYSASDEGTVEANAELAGYKIAGGFSKIDEIIDRIPVDDNYNETRYMNGVIVLSGNGRKEKLEFPLTSGTIATTADITAAIPSTYDLSKVSGTLSVEHGGTGQTSIAGIKSALGISSLGTASERNYSDSVGNNGNLPTGAAVQAYVNQFVKETVSASVQYLGTAAKLTDLSTTSGKGDFYRASAAFGGAHVGDLIIAAVDNPKQEIGETGYVVAHTEVDTNTWTANSASAAGYVPAGSGNNNKVYGTNGSGVPAWRGISATQGAVTQGSVTITHPARTGSGTFTPNVTAGKSSTTTKKFGTTYYETESSDGSIPAFTLQLGNVNDQTISYVSSVTGNSQSVSVSIAAAPNTTATTSGISVGNPTINIA